MNSESKTVVAIPQTRTNASNPAHDQLKKYYEAQILAQETRSVGSEPEYFDFVSIFRD